MSVGSGTDNPVDLDGLRAAIEIAFSGWTTPSKYAARIDEIERAVREWLLNLPPPRNPLDKYGMWPQWESEPSAAEIAPNLIVEFVVPHYFASLFAAQYPDEHGGFGAQVIFRNEDDHQEIAIGDVSFIENADGQWLINVELADGGTIRTFIDNVERIVVV